MTAKLWCLVAPLLLVFVISCSRGSGSGLAVNTDSPDSDPEKSTAPFASTPAAKPSLELDGADQPSYTSNLFKVAFDSQENQSAFSVALDNIGMIMSAIIRKVRALEFRQLNQGTVIVHWGNAGMPAGAPPGSELLFETKGYGFGPYYAHAGNRDAECLAPGARGGETLSGNYGDVIYPLITSPDVGYLPDAITSNTVLSCNLVAIPATTVEIHGTGKCPASWTPVYIGYLLGGHYAHAGRVSKPICVDEKDFDFSKPAVSGGAFSYVYGTHTYDSYNQTGAEHPTGRFLKCAVCAR